MLGPREAEIEGRGGAIFLLTCSDYGLTGLPYENSMRERLNGIMPTYEVRVPGGGLVLSDPMSFEAHSVIENFKLLASQTRFSRVILVSHADCAYHKLRYPGAAGRTAQCESNSHNELLEKSRNVIASIAGHATIESFFMPMEFVELGRSSSIRIDTPKQRQTYLSEMPSVRRKRTSTESLAVLDPLTASADDLRFAEIERMRMEANTHEFLDWLQSEGRAVSEREQRQLGTAFLKHYNRARLSRRDMRQVLNDVTRN